FTFAGLEEARRELDRFYRALDRAGEPAGGALPAPVLDALSDDLNTPLALASLHALSDAALAGDTVAAAGLRAGADVLGILPQPAASWFQGGEDNVADIEAAIEARLAARKARNFAEADRIRDELKARGILLEDSAGGTTWRRAS
ncbi:MAG: cysteine--tRNA ligase, partial [Acetobacteraceae bacterium]|nr:cysteine--tRNA ligase [Acetobacteraceae bacterium]